MFISKVLQRPMYHFQKISDTTHMGKRTAHVCKFLMRLLCTKIRSVDVFSILLDNGDKIALWCPPVIVHLH